MLRTDKLLADSFKLMIRSNGVEIQISVSNCKIASTVKSQVEARVTIQKIKSLEVLQTETCH